MKSLQCYKQVVSFVFSYPNYHGTCSGCPAGCHTRAFTVYELLRIGVTNFLFDPLSPQMHSSVANDQNSCTVKKNKKINWIFVLGCKQSVN